MYTKHGVLLFLLLISFVQIINAQDGPPQFVRDAVRNVEEMLDSEGDAAITTFIEEAMVSTVDRETLIEKLRNIRTEMEGLRDGIMVEAEPDGLRMIFVGEGVEKQVKVLLDFEAEAISDLVMLDSPESMHLTIDNLSETFDQLEEEGMAGVAYIKVDGKIIMERAFGMANKSLNIPNNLNTVFATGSRPIDYTVAAIFLLDQKGLINLDDPITKYFHVVPEDKQSMTIRHLMTGQSGLPDFFDTDDDWDPDLAWIDSHTALKRLLSQEVLFKPGTEQSHSHGAFGLLALLVEKVSDKSYYAFLREHFFDPAGMERTGEYGERRGLDFSDFAEGGGPQFIGAPNIPPNWGPTSWLIKGSGGMYSTLSDLLKFYDYVRSGKVLDEEHNSAFRRPTVNLDGSDRGFELFSAYMPTGSEVFLFINEQNNREKTRQLLRALELLVVNTQ